MELICVIETSTISLASNAAMILRRSSGLSSRSATCERCLARPFFYVRPTLRARREADQDYLDNTWLLIAACRPCCKC